jgi:hypothetical protein
VDTFGTEGIRQCYLRLKSEQPLSPIAPIARGYFPVSSHSLLVSTSLHTMPTELIESWNQERRREQNARAQQRSRELPNPCADVRGSLTDPVKVRGERYSNTLYKRTTQLCISVESKSLDRSSNKPLIRTARKL